MYAVSFLGYRQGHLTTKSNVMWSGIKKTTAALANFVGVDSAADYC